jgi:hypothetical protein
MDKLVRIRDSTYNELAKRGKWNDTMDSIIQQLLQQEKKHRIDEATKKSQRERQPVQESNVQEGVEYVSEPFDNGDSNIRNYNRTSKVHACYAIAGHRAKQEAEDPDEVIEKKRQRKRMIIPNCEDDDKKEPQGAPSVGLQVKRQTAGIHSSCIHVDLQNKPILAKEADSSAG